MVINAIGSECVGMIVPSADWLMATNASLCSPGNDYSLFPAQFDCDCVQHCVGEVACSGGGVM